LYDDKPVKACMCYPYTFAELKDMAAKNNWTTLAQIREEVGCSTGCGLCRPYLLKMLETGETEFAVLDDDSA
jgi:bacterioferritin-associated ferredoxin